MGSYFNNEVKNLENKINGEIEKISKQLTNISSILEINANQFYLHFSQPITKINLQLKSKQAEYKEFLGYLKTTLESKKNNLFSVMSELEIDAPQNFSQIKNDLKELINKNNDFSENLKKEQEQAKNSLRYHIIHEALNKFNHNKEDEHLKFLKKQKHDAEEKLQSERKKLDDKQQEKIKLIAQTKDENQIAQKINECLEKAGVQSFSLELIADNQEYQKGQYQIRGYNGEIRKITELSKGEKNIIALLYFLFSLESIDDKNNTPKPKIIILDDPMTSNDDTMQYLMIGEISNCYKNKKANDKFILLTHNCHFYLNVRPYPI
nr:AAA family ATPase [Stenoxybacter acetivorans]